VRRLAKMRLFTLLMVAMLIAMIVARLHPHGLSDGGYW